MTERSPTSSIDSSEPVMTSFDGGDAAPAAVSSMSAMSAVSAVSDVEQSDSVAHTQADDTATDTADLPLHSLVWCLSVYLSVCPSHAAIVSKRLNLS